MAVVRNIRPSGIRRHQDAAKPASTAFVIESLIAPNEDNTTNTFVAASASVERVLGSLQKEIASGDSDYADETKVSYEIDEGGEWEFTVGTGTPDVNDEQGYIDLKDADEADVEATVIDMIFVTRSPVSSATKVRGSIVRWAHLEPPATN